MLKPRHSVVIYICNPFCVRIYFARPIDLDVLLDIKQLSCNEGVEVQQSKDTGRPWLVTVSPTYDTKDVAYEIEQILRKHGINEISIKIDEIGSTKEIKTLKGLV